MAESRDVERHGEQAVKVGALKYLEKLNPLAYCCAIILVDGSKSHSAKGKDELVPAPNKTLRDWIQNGRTMASLSREEIELLETSLLDCFLGHLDQDSEPTLIGKMYDDAISFVVAERLRRDYRCSNRELKIIWPRLLGKTGGGTSELRETGKLTAVDLICIFIGGVILSCLIGGYYILNPPLEGNLDEAGAVSSQLRSGQHSDSPDEGQTFVPKAGFVPNAQVATVVAVAILKPIYGASEIEMEEPFQASLTNGVWTVVGTFKAAPGRHGGAAEIQLSQIDGKILSVTHGK